mgnify:CR=1 FL=1
MFCIQCIFAGGNKNKMGVNKLVWVERIKKWGFYFMAMLLILACQSGNGNDKKIPSGSVHIRFEEGKYVLFLSGSDSVLTSPKFYQYRDSLMRVARQGLMTVVTGLYDDTESYNGTYQDLGLARAEAIKRLLAKQIPSSRIQCRSEKVRLDPVGGKPVYEAFKIHYEPLTEN